MIKVWSGDQFWGVWFVEGHVNSTNFITLNRLAHTLLHTLVHTFQRPMAVSGKW